jgi:hypothetical protein
MRELSVRLSVSASTEYGGRPHFGLAQRHALAYSSLAVASVGSGCSEIMSASLTMSAELLIRFEAG